MGAEYPLSVSEFLALVEISGYIFMWCFLCPFRAAVVVGFWSWNRGVVPIRVSDGPENRSLGTQSIGYSAN